MEIIHQPNIGFIYDVCRVIICKTSKRETWLNSSILSGNEDTDIALMDATLNQFSSVDRCWNMLTMQHPEKGRLITKLYLDFINDPSYECETQTFVEYISNITLLKQTIAEWYFVNKNTSNEECYNQLHNNPDIDDIVRINLFEFFTVPEKYVIRMQESLRLVIREMHTFHEKHHNLIDEKKKQVDNSKLFKNEKVFMSTFPQNSKIKTCAMAFSLINRYIILRDESASQEFEWILLGIDYDKEIEALENSVDLIGFGNALGDTTRLNILKEIHLNGEKTLTDLSTKFKLVNAVMLYHLDILKKQRLLGQRHEGRRVYYWLNYSRFKQAIHTINSMFGGELIETVEKALTRKRKQ